MLKWSLKFILVCTVKQANKDPQAWSVLTSGKDSTTHQELFLI